MIRFAFDDKPDGFWTQIYTPEYRFLNPSGFKLINTTPLGMFPKAETFPAIPYSALTADHFLYDLVYNPEETVFLKKGRTAGAKTMNGMQMLRLQADYAWKIWCESA